MPDSTRNRDEIAKCAVSSAYLIDEYCYLEDKIKRAWLPFKLWTSQWHTLTTILKNRQVIILKARQLGLTWLMIGYALWMMLFRPGSGILVFSRRDDEAAELLDRLRGMHSRLPPFLQAEIETDNEHELTFINGSSAQSFPTTKHSGRSYTATLAIIDEADFIPWLSRLIVAVKPTIDAGGQIVLLSTANKDAPDSEFKRILNRSLSGDGNYTPVFLPWSARPERTAEWFARQKADYTPDDLAQEYPATIAEALAARSADKRFAPQWLTKCTGTRQPLDSTPLPIVGLAVFQTPQPGHSYIVAADPAEGNPTSNPSPASVFDRQTWEQVAVLNGKWEPAPFANNLILLAKYYTNAEICWERNNHGHAVTVAIENAGYPYKYISPFDHKPGWLTNKQSKINAVDNTADALQNGSCTINDQATLAELAHLISSTLAAPAGQHDDLAMTVIIGLAAIVWPSADSGDLFAW